MMTRRGMLSVDSVATVPENQIALTSAISLIHFGLYGGQVRDIAQERRNNVYEKSSISLLT